MSQQIICKRCGKIQKGLGDKIRSFINSRHPSELIRNLQFVLNNYEKTINKMKKYDKNRMREGINRLKRDIKDSKTNYDEADVRRTINWINSELEKLAEYMNISIRDLKIVQQDIRKLKGNIKSYGI